MRRIRKGSPPANVSPDGQDARSMADARDEFLASLATTLAERQSEHARNAFRALDKPKLRELLYVEQHYLCVYCERRVHEKRTPSVEHWRSLSGEPVHALDWDNLYLSCPTDETCDRWKEDRKLAWEPGDNPLPWPVHLDYERCVGSASNGTLYVRTDAPLTDAQRRALQLAIDDCQREGQPSRSVLNLNEPKLREARVAAIVGERDRLAREFRGRTATPDERRKLADDLLRRARREEFTSTRVAYLTRTLGKSRPPPAGTQG